MAALPSEYVCCDDKGKEMSRLLRTRGNKVEHTVSALLQCHYASTVNKAKTGKNWCCGTKRYRFQNHIPSDKQYVNLISSLTQTRNMTPMFCFCFSSSLCSQWLYPSHNSTEFLKLNWLIKITNSDISNSTQFVLFVICVTAIPYCASS